MMYGDGMGFHRHHAIVVTTHSDDHIAAAHEKAVELFGELVSNKVPWARDTNTGWSFFIGPDGSSEGWDASDHYDTQRAAFKAWIQASGNYAYWCEVIVGDDNRHGAMVDHGGYYSTVQGIAEHGG